ncbi:MAG: hypothetical protein ABIB97_00595 [Patescibacteria group bacterium]
MKLFRVLSIAALILASFASTGCAVLNLGGPLLRDRYTDPSGVRYPGRKVNPFVSQSNLAAKEGDTYHTFAVAEEVIEPPYMFYMIKADVKRQRFVVTPRPKIGEDVLYVKVWIDGGKAKKLRRNRDYEYPFEIRNYGDNGIHAVNVEIAMGQVTRDLTNHPIRGEQVLRIERIFAVVKTLNDNEHWRLSPFSPLLAKAPHTRNTWVEVGPNWIISAGTREQEFEIIPRPDALKHERVLSIERSISGEKPREVRNNSARYRFRQKNSGQGEVLMTFWIRYGSIVPNPDTGLPVIDETVSRTEQFEVVLIMDSAKNY